MCYVCSMANEKQYTVVELTFEELPYTITNGESSYTSYRQRLFNILTDGGIDIKRPFKEDYKKGKYVFKQEILNGEI